MMTTVTGISMNNLPIVPRKSGFALLVLASTALYSPALANEFPANFPLSSLNGSNGYRADLNLAEYSVTTVSTAGDVNGDGIDDVIIGAASADPHGDRSGSSYVVFGRAAGIVTPFDLTSLDGSNGFRLDGVAVYDSSGDSVSSAGDVNGDGFGDVIVGAWGADPRGGNSGSGYVVFGRPSGFVSTIALSSLTGSNGFRLDGVAAEDGSSYSVAAAGDVNGDGFGDVIVGAPNADPHGSYSGSSYVVFGKPAGFTATFNLSSLNGSNGFRLDGMAAEYNSGQSVSSAGDVNGDRYDDVIIGTVPGFPSYVVFGRATGFTATVDLSSLNGSNGLRLDGNRSGGRFSATTVSAGGDVNGDGFGDVIVGEDRANTGDPRTYSGASYVVFGKKTPFPAVLALSNLDGLIGFRINGADNYDRSGFSVSTAGDVNGDGFGDVIIGSVYSDSGGSSYVVFGRAPDHRVTRVGAAADQYISGGPFRDSLSALAGSDRLEGRGGADNLKGGAASDTAVYKHAPTGVTASLALPDSNTGDAAGDQYASIENLTGSEFADRLTGNGAANRITGLGGRDQLTGSGGPDLFIFFKVSDSQPGVLHDTITDFKAGTATTSVDRIDINRIDAKAGISGNQSFSFIGTQGFSSTKGQLRVQAFGADAIISGDVDGDGAADLEIRLKAFSNIAGLTAADFRL